VGGGHKPWIQEPLRRLSSAARANISSMALRRTAPGLSSELAAAVAAADGFGGSGGRSERVLFGLGAGSGSG
jgi:hypothetical protein